MRCFKAFLFAAACVGAIATAAPAAQAQEEVYDPYEGFNRDMFAVHETVDQAVFEPVAKGYRRVTPRFFRTGVRNFLRNLGAPVTLANDVMQGEVKRAGTTIARFGVNTTVGLLGVMDPATEMGLEYHSEDFGQTLATWGTPSGPYFFLPLVGPTNMRDGAGRVVDIAINPTRWAEFDGDTETRFALTAIGAMSARAAVIEPVEDIRRTSLDPYVTYRTTYGLYRYSAIQNGRRDVQDLPDFESIETYEDIPTEETAPFDPLNPEAPEPESGSTEPQSEAEPETKLSPDSPPNAGLSSPNFALFDPGAIQ